MDDSTKETIEKVANTGEKAVSIFRLVKALGAGFVGLIVCVVMLIAGVPWYIVLFFFLVITVVVAISIVRVIKSFKS